MSDQAEADDMQDVTDAAAALAGEAVTAIKRVGGGRNSRVFRLDTQSGCFALKQYPSLTDDPRDRLGTERQALTLMAEHGIEMVPRFVAADRARNFALLSWADGSLVRDPNEHDTDQALVFLERLHALRDAPSIPDTWLAAEACLSGAEIERQIRARVAHLSALENEPELKAFMDGAFGESFGHHLGRAKARARQNTVAFDNILPVEKRSLVPSDFGFHNALRAETGKLTFIDFEYFGWDDPVKLTADLLLHPGTVLESSLRERIRAGAQIFYGSDPDFTDRLATFFPLFGLRWVLILLNEFHPERWRRRILAGATESWSEAKARQLSAARTMLSSLAS